MADPVVNLIFRATDQTKGVLNGLGSALGGLGKIALGVAAGGIALLGAGLALSVKEAMEAQEVDAKLAQVIAATGGAAGVTAKSASALADAFAKTTRFSDETIKSAETVLLRFKAIGKDVFPQATKVTLDLATALGIDASSAATMLGKALETPGEGMLRLKAAGVALSDEQIDLIKKLAETGDMAGAQKMIMDELAKSVGGAAEASGKTFAGQLDILKNSLLNVAEGVGTALLPILQDLMTNVILPALPAIQRLGELFADFFSILGDAGANSIEMKEFLESIFGEEMTAKIMGVIGWLQGFANTITTEIWPAIIDFAGVVWSQLGPGLAQLGIWIQDLASAALPLLQAAIQFVIEHWQVFAIIAAVVGAVILALNAPIAAIIAAVVLLATAWANNWGGIRDFLTGVWENVLGPIFETVRAWLAENIPIALQTLSDFWTGVLQPAIVQVWAWMQAVLIPFIQDVLYTWIHEIIPAAIQFLSDYWTNILRPAIEQVWSWISSVLIPFLRDVLYPWIKDTLTAAIQILSDYWTNILKPAIELVWGFIQKDLIPLFTALGTLLGVTLSLILTALAGLWEKVLQPALNTVYEFIRDHVMPIIQDLADKITVALKPVLDALEKFLSGVLKTAFAGISDAIQKVIGWINDLIEALKNIKLPDWLTPGSPTPFEMGLRGIASAMGDLNRMQLPAFSANLGALGIGGTPISNTTNFYLTAQYREQSPTSLAQDVRMLQLLYGQ